MVIRFFTWSDISHVDLVLPVTGQLLGAHTTCGVNVRQPGYAKFTRIITAEVEDSAEVAGKVHNLASNELGKPYDHGASVISFCIAIGGRRTNGFVRN
jgi:hypothetical protein